MRLRGCLNRRGGIHGNLRGVFTGPEGVRAVWRVLLFLALLALQLVIVAVVFAVVLRHAGYRHITLPAQLTPLFVSGNELTLLLPVLGASWSMAFLEDVSLTSYGLEGLRKIPRLLGGLAGGLAALSVLILILLVTGYGVATGGVLGLAGDFRYGAEWLAVSLLIGFTEEFAFRGYLLRTLGRGIGFWPGALLTSVLFGALHGSNQSETFLGLLNVGCTGLLFCLSIRLTGSLWWAIGFHGGWDYAENFIFGTRDSGNSCYGTLMNFLPRGNPVFSGGLTGPEGSVFCLVVLGVAMGCVWLVLSAREPARI
jgi:membrane protease YdiL (CAAX protease family)